jgi:hypothetical protein
VPPAALLTRPQQLLRARRGLRGHLPSARAQRLDRLFECLEGVVRTCPECSKKKLPLGALIVHLNDAHHWTRDRIAAWVADPDVPQNESHAHH